MKPRIFVIEFFLFSMLYTFAQDTIYIGKNGVEVEKLEQMDSYKIVHIDSSNINRATITTYFKSGKIRSKVNVVNERSLKSNEYKIGIQAVEMYNDIRWLYDGAYLEWYESGKTRKEIGFRKGGHSNLLLIYWENGKLKRKAIYDDKNWEWISGECYDQNGNNVFYYPYYSDAVYEKGNFKSPGEFYSSKLSYPVGAIKRKACASIAVFTQFDNTGKVIDAFMRHPVDKDLDTAAIALAKSIGALTKPAYVDNEPIAQLIMFTFNYNLPKFTIDLIEQANGRDSVYLDQNGYLKLNKKGCSKILLFKPVPGKADNLFFSTFNNEGKRVSFVQISKSKTLENLKKHFKPLTNNSMSTMRMLEICEVTLKGERSQPKKTANK